MGAHGARRREARRGRCSLGASLPSACQRKIAADAQPFTEVRPEFLGVLTQPGGQAKGKPRFQRIISDNREVLIEVAHNEIPFVFRAFAKACTAREQCVLTLPSEHPMAAAVSATSNSSQ